MRFEQNTKPFEHMGEVVTFGELAKRTGLAYTTIWDRYRYGKRGAELVRKPRIKARNIDRAKLAEFAAQGMKTAEMARRIGIGRSRFPEVLRKHGLHRVWQTRRFKKCNGAKQDQTRLEANAAT